MSRATYRRCKVCEDIHEVSAWPHNCMAQFERPNRSTLAMPSIVSDGMTDTVNPLDGRTYDSKSAYYRKVKDSGCEIVGNDSAYVEPKTPTFETPGGVEADIATAIQQLGG